MFVQRHDIMSLCTFAGHDVAPIQACLTAESAPGFVLLCVFLNRLMSSLHLLSLLGVG